MAVAQAFSGVTGLCQPERGRIPADGTAWKRQQRGEVQGLGTDM